MLVESLRLFYAWLRLQTEKCNWIEDVIPKMPYDSISSSSVRSAQRLRSLSESEDHPGPLIKLRSKGVVALYQMIVYF